MYFTYVLFCEDDKYKTILYIGYCDNLRKRYYQHLHKGTETTKKYSKITLIYYEACSNKTDAIKRELQLKTGFGRGYLKRRLENYFQKQR